MTKRDRPVSLFSEHEESAWSTPVPVRLKHAVAISYLITTWRETSWLNKAIVRRFQPWVGMQLDELARTDPDRVPLKPGA